jgi:hypothetical protein
MQPLLQWKSNKYYLFWEFVSSLRYPTCNAHAPYCNVWPVLLYLIFFTLSHEGKIFEKKKMLLNIKCVFWFSLQLLSETFLILRRTERGMIKNVYGSSCKMCIFLSNFNETWIFCTDFRRMLKYQLHDNPSSGSRVVPCGRTDRQDAANSQFSHFFERT